MVRRSEKAVFISDVLLFLFFFIVGVGTPISSYLFGFLCQIVNRKFAFCLSNLLLVYYTCRELPSIAFRATVRIGLGATRRVGVGGLIIN